MISKFNGALSIAILGIALVAPSAHAQGRGMRASGAATPARSSFGPAGAGGFVRTGQRRLLNNSGYFLPPYFFYNDEIDDGLGAPEGAHVQLIVANPPQPPPPPARPVEPLLIENRGGQWVRVPTGNQIQAAPESTKPAPAPLPSLQPGITGPAGEALSLPELPPARIVFRDGHMEEVQKYMIQGGVLYTTSDYWTTGSWTRKIPLAELDIPASLKLNKERGTKFNLPSAPNEVVIRF
jgi:hypothetical protein